MKCKNCRTRISFLSWLCLKGRCTYCDDKIDEINRKRGNIKREIQEKDSKKYWKKHDALHAKAEGEANG